MSNIQTKTKRFMDLYVSLTNSFFNDPNVAEISIHFSEPIPLRGDELELVRTAMNRMTDKIKSYTMKVNEDVLEKYYYKENEKVLVLIYIAYTKEGSEISKIQKVKLKRYDIV